MTYWGPLSTDYTMVLALVGIVTLVFFSTIGGFIRFDTGERYKSSRIYWNNADIGLASWRVSAKGESRFMVVNNMDYTIEIETMTVNIANLTNANKVVILPKRGKNIIENISDICRVEEPYSLRISFVYNDVQHDVPDIRLRGEKNIEGICLP